MKKIVFLLTVFLAQASMAAEVTVGELKGTIKAEDLAGSYVNSEGDRVSLELIEQKGQQPDLFKKEYELYASSLFSKFDLELDLNTSYVYQEEDGSVRFGYTGECEDPGCEEYELSFTVNKDRSGKMALQASIEYGKLIDDEESFETQEAADARCSSYNAKNIKNAVEATLNDDGSIWCRLSDEVSLQKK